MRRYIVLLLLVAAMHVPAAAASVPSAVRGATIYLPVVAMEHPPGLGVFDCVDAVDGNPYGTLSLYGDGRFNFTFTSTGAITQPVEMRNGAWRFGATSNELVFDDFYPIERATLIPPDLIDANPHMVCTRRVIRAQ